MSLSSLILKHVYNANGTQTNWDFSFPIILTTDMVVIITDSDGVETVLTSNYDVDTVLSRVVYPTAVSGLPALASGNKITLKRVEPFTQQLVLQNQAPFNATDVEKSLDKLTMIAQQIQEEVDRCPKQAESTPTVLDLILPTADTGKAIGWASDGTLTNIDVTTVAGLGTMSTQNATAVAITGGVITGITDLAIADGGTGQSNAQLAINALTQVSSGTNEHVLTKDTNTGNAIWKSVPSGVIANDGATTDYQVSTTNAFVTGAAAAIDGARVTHKGVADQIQVLIQGNGTQNGNILEVRKSDSTVALGVSNTAGTTIGGTTSQIKDTNGNELIKFTATGSAVNELTLANAATGNDVTLSTTGGDSNIGLTISCKGTGAVNLRQKQRVNTVASSATPSINTDTTDMFTITALAVAITSMTTNLSGTPNNGQKLVIRFKDDGTGRAITWGASFASRGATLLATTTANKVSYVGLIWNSTASTWDCVATVTES